MKKMTMMLSLLAAAAITSCNKVDEGANQPAKQNADVAYVTLEISSPQSKAIEGDKVEGTAEENGVSSVALLAFDDNYDYITAYSKGTIGTNDSGLPTYTCEIAPDSRYFFAIVNPSDKLSDMISSFSVAGSASGEMFRAIKMEVSEVSQDNKFTMVNEGSMDGSFVAAEGELSIVEANPTVIHVNVDRIVSKFNYTVNSALDVVGGTGSVTGVKLNATNKFSYVYSEIATDQLTGNNDYRKDPNMRLGEDPDSLTADLAKLNWLKNNKDEESFYASSVCEYVLENTCDPAFHDYNNLTQAVVKAVYTPSGVDGVAAGDSWFAINIIPTGTVQMSFAKVVEYYNAASTSADTKAKMDAQLNHILSSNGKTWADATLSLADLDAVKNGGYKAATAENYIVQYYQNSVNYYDIFIQHDSEQPIGHLGRWGMVRNNAYTMNVNKILAPGLPYIPDPTDPDITDPKNPNPEDPEPADKLNAFVEATINVNDWTVWSQETDLI